MVKHTQYWQRETPDKNQTTMYSIIRGTVNVQVVHRVQCDTLPCGVEKQLMVDPEPSTSPACTVLPWGHKQLPTHSGKHSNDNMPAHTTKDMTPSAVTTHHADTKEDAAQILCEWYNNVHTDMIGYFLGAQGQTDRPSWTGSMQESIQG